MMCREKHHNTEQLTHASSILGSQLWVWDTCGITYEAAGYLYIRIIKIVLWHLLGFL